MRKLRDAQLIEINHSSPARDPVESQYGRPRVAMDEAAPKALVLLVFFFLLSRPLVGLCFGLASPVLVARTDLISRKVI